jgi:hypothetical protein
MTIFDDQLHRPLRETMQDYEIPVAKVKGHTLESPTAKIGI